MPRNFFAYKNTFFSDKHVFFGDFAKSKKSLVFEPMGTAQLQLKSAGARPRRLSPWAFKGLGLLEHLLVALILQTNASKARFSTLPSSIFPLPRFLFPLIVPRLRISFSK